MSVSETWGTIAAERQQAFPCDDSLPRVDAELFRGISITAPAHIVFRWLCQLRAAPYSYDWIDNRGKQSPQELTAGLDQLETGQDVMSIFTLTSFLPNEHLTLRLKPTRRAQSVFGDIAVSYLIKPQSDSSCRLLVKLVARYPSTIRGRLLASMLPWADLIMMRRQLLNLKRLAEEQWRRRGK